MEKVKYRPLYPVGTSPVRKDKDLYLLNVDYDIVKDELMILYKRYSNGEKILDIIHKPEVPVFIYTKSDIKDKREYLRYEDCVCYLVNYRERDLEIQNILIGIREISYKDSYGNTHIRKLKNKNLPLLGKDTDRSALSAVQFSPKLAMSDMAITDLIMLEYSNTRYHAHETMKVLNTLPYFVDDVQIPEFHRAAWDIETHIVDDKNDPKYEMINAISYVDDKYRECKLVYLLDEEYAKQDLLVDKEAFYADTVKLFKMAVDDIDSGDSKTDEKIKKMCHEFIDSLNWSMDAYTSEQKMIEDMMNHMYNVRKPDILAAFNTSYDLSKSEARLKKLKGHTKDMNGKEYDCEPTYWWGGDSYHPLDRRVNLTNKSLVVNEDFQSTHYRNRASEVHTNHSLEYTSNKIIHMGKWDFSDICNSITRLPRVDFYRFMQYSALDSILIILDDNITNDFKIKHLLCHTLKVNFQQYHQNMSKIPCATNSMAYRYGDLATPNTNKLIKYLNVSDMEGVEETLGIKNLAQIKREITSGKSINGGLVADPNLFEGPTPYSDFNNEVALMHNMIHSLVCYIDASAMYPTKYITNNLSKTTLIGTLVGVYKNLTDGKPNKLEDLKLLVTTDEKEAKASKLKPHKDLGMINSAVIMDNILKLGELLFGLPSPEKLLQEKYGGEEVEAISLTTADEEDSDEEQVIETGKLVPRLTQIFSGMNKTKLSDIDATSLTKEDEDSDDEDEFDYNEVASVKIPYLQKKSAKYFPISNDATVFKYYGTHVRQVVISGNMYEEFNIPREFHGKSLYGRINKNTFIVDNSMLTVCRLDPTFENIVEAYEGVIELPTLLRVANEKVFTENINLNGYAFYATERLIYYPFAIAFKQAIKANKSDKYMVSDLHYKLFVREKTALLQLTYEVYSTTNDFRCSITQSMNIIKIRYNESPMRI